MKLENTNHSVASSPGDSIACGISTANMGHIQSILRSGLYSDIYTAVLREYATNAWDAHNMCGKGDVPIKVTLPTHENPVLEIRDFGPGLSQDEVFNVYASYGASSKRDTNVAAGCLGIGSKSAFAYTDLFTIISRHNGTCSHYSAYLGDDDIGYFKKLHEEPCDISDTGICIVVSVKKEHISLFRSHAAYLFQFFDPKPIIDISLPDWKCPSPGIVYSINGRRVAYDKTIINTNVIGAGEIEHKTSWTAIMGCVAYPIDLSKLNVMPYIQQMAGFVRFEIGELTIAASREALKYNKTVNDIIVSRINDVVDNFVAATLRSVASDSVWARSLYAKNFTSVMGIFGKNSVFGNILSGNIRLEAPTVTPPAVPIIKLRSSYIQLDPQSRLVVMDDKRAYAGYSFRPSNIDMLIEVNSENAIDEAMVEIEKMVNKYGINGIPIVRTSQLPWEAPYRKTKSVNKKHTVKRERPFLLNKVGGEFHRPLSQYWDLVDEDKIPDNPIYVVMSNFKPDNNFQQEFLEDFLEDLAILKPYNAVPKIYGYKFVKKGPNWKAGDPDPNVHKGTPYHVWRKSLIENLLLTYPEVSERIAHIKLTNMKAQDFGRYNENIAPDLAWAWQKMLGDTHPFALFIKQLVDSSKIVNADRYHDLNRIARTIMARQPGDRSSNPGQIIKSILDKRYPLIYSMGYNRVVGHNVDKTEREAWVDYIKAMDLLNPWG